MQPAVEVSANYSASFNGPGRCALWAASTSGAWRIVAETIPHRCRCEPSRDTSLPQSLSVCPSGERRKITCLQINLTANAVHPLKNISPQSVSLVLYPPMRKQLAALLLCFLVISTFAQQPTEPSKSTTIAKPRAVRSAAKVCTACIRAHMEFLASDALRG